MNSRSTASASKRLAVYVVALLTLLVLPRTASAERRLVILEFEGPRSSQFRREVVRQLRGDNELIPERDFQRQKKQIRGFDGTPEKMARLAKELDADGIVSGEVARRGRNFVLTIKIREGLSGEFTSREVTFRGRRPKFTGKPGRRFRRSLRAAVSELPDRSELDDASEPAAEESEEVDPAEEEEEAELDDAEVSAVDDDAPVEVSDAVLADRSMRSRGLELRAGLSFTSRRLTFTADPDAGEAPQGYAGKAVPGVFLDAELYPMAFDLERNGALRDVGITATVDKVLKIESTLEGRDDVVLSTSQTSWGVGAVYRHNFGDDPSSPTVKASVRYGSSSFVVDETGAPEGTVIALPDVTYTYLDPGLSVRYPVTAQIALEGEGRFYVVRGTGEMQEADAYGGATVSGYGLFAGGEYRINEQLVIQAGARLQRFAFTFAGTGDLTDRNADDMQDVGGAADRYLSGYLTAGYVF